MLEAFVGAEAGAGGAAQLAADLSFVAGGALRGPADERMVGLVAGQGGRSGPAVGGAQDVELALGYAAAFAVEPDEGVVVVGGAQVDERAVGPRGRDLVGLGGVDDGGHLFDRLLETGFAVGGVVPDLVGVGGEIDLGVVVAVEDAGLFVVEIVNARVSSSSKKASSVPTTSAFSLSLVRTRARSRIRRSMPSAGRKE